MSFCYDNEWATVLAPDKVTLVTRIPIRRSGYWVVRYKGHYHQVHGGCRVPMFMGQVPQGKTGGSK
jgi:hypothetical protein